jgi:hypothetical protein
VPASVKLQELYGDDVQVVFVECQNTSKDVYQAFAWKMKWMGNGAMWTAERPLPTKGNGLPETALIGIDGTVLMQGNPGDFGKKLEAAVAAEIKKAKEAPAGTPNELKKAWQLFNKDEIAAAIAECEKVANDAAGKAKIEFVKRTTARLERAKRILETGQIGAAEKLLGALEKGVKGHAELEAKVAEQKAALAAPALASEREADKAFASFVAKIAREKPFDPGNVKKAEALASKYKGTKSAERAERFVALSKIELNK